MLNLNFQILGEILICHNGGCQSSFDHVKAKSELWNSSFLAEILVSHTWGDSVIFDNVQAESDLNFKVKIQPACGKRWLTPPGMTDQDLT